MAIDTLIKMITIGISFFLLSNSIISISNIKDNENIISASNISNRTWIVDNEGDGDFNYIQEAIDAAIIGDTIKIYSGIYHENIVINKKNLIVLGIDFELGIGADIGAPIIDGRYIDSCIILDSEQISLTCCIIKHCGNETTNAGIKIQASNQMISDNIIYENNNGIYISESGSNNIFNNNISYNERGVYVSNSNYNTISENDFLNNRIGVDLELVAYNTVEGNNIFQNLDEGILVNDSWYNTIIGNFISENNNGILLLTSKINDIFQNSISRNTRGINLKLASNRNNISNNIISDNVLEGILVEGSSTNIFTNNNINHNQHGLICDATTFNIIKDNIVHNNQQNGLVIISTNNNDIINNDIISNKYQEGILLSDSNENNLSYNEILNSGISCYNSPNNLIFNNKITNPLNGIYLNSSDNNLIVENSISLSNFDGIYITSSFDNLLYHNFLIDNYISAFDVNGMNSWDNGYPDGGNYWSDYDESNESANDLFSGPQQDESFSDGIVDEPYIIPGTGSEDRYPLMHPWGVPMKPSQPQGVNRGVKGKSYRYSTSSIDPNGDLIQYGWDWDGDKAVDEWTIQYASGEIVKTTHTWESDGEYLIHVKAMDEHGGKSDWSDPLLLTVPKIKENNFSLNKFVFQNTFFSWLIDLLIVRIN